MTKPGTKLSRRYFVSMLGLGAVAAAVGSNVLASVAEKVTETVVDKTRLSASQATEFCKRQWGFNYLVQSAGSDMMPIWVKLKNI